MAKIYCSPCAEGPGAWTHAYELLKQLHAGSALGLHQWVDSPEAADIIFLCNPQQQDGDVAATQPLRLKYPNKCFLLSEQWTPEPRYAGIYSNAPRKALWRGRFRSASYALHHPDFKNPYVQRFEPSQALPPAKREVLFSFAGRAGHPVREKLFQLSFHRPDVVVQETSEFDAFCHGDSDKDAAQRQYYELCLRSKFILCPRGAGPNSIRLFEALQLGIAPVIIADDWIPCEGPAWKRFALFVPEKHLGRIEEIVISHEKEFLERGREARRAYEAFFAPQSYFNYLVSSARSIQRNRILSERMILRLEPVLNFYDRIWRKAFRAVDGRLTSTSLSRHPFLRHAQNSTAFILAQYAIFSDLL